MESLSDYPSMLRKIKYYWSFPRMYDINLISSLSCWNFPDKRSTGEELFGYQQLSKCAHLCSAQSIFFRPCLLTMRQLLLLLLPLSITMNLLVNKELFQQRSRRLLTALPDLMMGEMAAAILGYLPVFFSTTYLTYSLYTIKTEMMLMITVPTTMATYTTCRMPSRTAESRIGSARLLKSGLVLHASIIAYSLVLGIMEPALPQLPIPISTEVSLLNLVVSKGLGGVAGGLFILIRKNHRRKQNLMWWDHK